MAAARSKVPPIGSAQWVLDERHQSNDLVAQELEDFGFSVRNELEWLNEHMADIFAYDGQNNLDVYKTPGKLRGKTPRTARKKNAEPRQPLGDLFTSNAQNRPSPAQQSLQKNLHKNLAKARFQIAEDTENTAPAHSPTRSPVPRPLFVKPIGKGKENQDSGYHANTSEDEMQEHRPAPARWSPAPSTQDTVMYTQDTTQIFTQEATQSTQPTQAMLSMQRSIQQSEDERRDTGESFVSAKEAFASNNASKENLHEQYRSDVMEVDDNKQDKTESDTADTVIRHNVSSIHDTTTIHHTLMRSPQQQPRVISEQYSTSADFQEGLDTATHRVHAPPSKKAIVPSEQYGVSAETDAALDVAAHQDDTVVHHDIEDQMDLDDEDVRSPSDGSSPVKPLVRKSSLTFASLPAREPLLAKKSMGNRVSRTSHVDQSKSRTSQLGRFTGGKSLGGSQHAPGVETRHDDALNIEDERPEIRREESETTKLHNKTSTQRLADRINMLKQKNEPAKRTSQHLVSSQPSQPLSFASSQAAQPSQPAQPVYPVLSLGEPEKDDDDDWISPIRSTAPSANLARPVLSKSYSADTRPPFVNGPIFQKPISVSNPDRSTVVESTTPAGSPTGKKYMDGPLSASKAKFYSALRAAKEKIIGSSATSAQVKLDALVEGPMRPKLQPQSSSDDVFSPKRNEKAGTSIFSHLRSPSKESVKSTKSTKISQMPGSPIKDDGCRTRSSSERERQKETKEREAKQKQRTEDKLKEMREREQSKAAAHYQKTKAAAAAAAAAATTKTPIPMPPQPNVRPAPAPSTAKTPVSIQQQPLSRPGTTRINTTTRNPEPDFGDEMPPPPPPKSLLPTGTGHKLREPKRLIKTASKDQLLKAKPQAIKVNLHRFGQAPLVTSKPAPPAAAAKPPPAPPKSAPVAAPKPAPRPAPPAAKSAPRIGRPQPTKVIEKSKPAPAQSRADLGAARAVSRMQTVQDANRINVPPVNPAKPAKRPFQPENDEPLHRPAKRPSQQMKSKPVTPAHAQFAQGKIPFAEPAQPTIQYPNDEEIKLPEIMTDSEDEDSENEFEVPSWVNTPNLQEMLKTQQLMDPEQIFGPIAPLNMEQIFPNKDRHKKFRERTSSAYWSNDQVTEEEKRKEREARERLAREGAWSYHPSPGPSNLH
ncbi:uncharacterized protein BDR25DRAFT_295086 [Lindgomyces ingoldianus]|uniref:Uncharacterized protein n=1 Tax=Lindgomyces ingoldianus TaxID=673940 RepID=A0ACB6QET0_9PLEO|nr:uncharacterized protein BDR25DRAFT_295086 [Lindgomyces ingoldianus]KAF2465524.1 hypothetical protein BDR25DRAFT_295086 [Lindgomyces ingoldianus]